MVAKHRVAGVKLFLGLDPHRCSNELSVSFCSPVAFAGSGQWHSYAEDKQSLAADHGSTSPWTEELWVAKAQSPCGYEPCLNGSRSTDTRHDAGLVYDMYMSGY